jgi:predicted signal transduction protein with EAL and GGDEF domain
VSAATSEQLLAKADAALYQSKQAGRNRITIAETPAAAGFPSAAAGSHTLPVPA